MGNVNIEHWIHWAHMDHGSTAVHLHTHTHITCFYIWFTAVDEAWYQVVPFALRFPLYNKIHATRPCSGFCIQFEVMVVFSVPCLMFIACQIAPFTQILSSEHFCLFARLLVRNVHIICGRTHSAHNKRQNCFGRQLKCGKQMIVFFHPS